MKYFEVTAPEPERASFEHCKQLAEAVRRSARARRSAAPRRDGEKARRRRRTLGGGGDSSRVEAHQGQEVRLRRGGG